jgi:glutathione S-transferase
MVEVQILGPQFSNFVRSVQLCCEEKSVPYQLGMQLDGSEVVFKSDQHLALHPFGKVPALKHGERTLIETATICRYIDSAFDGMSLQPEDLYQRALVDQWSHIIAGYIDQALVREYLLEFAFPKGEGGSIRMEKVAEQQPNVINMIRLLEKQIADNAFICGEQYTIADALLTPMLDYLEGLPHSAVLLPPESQLHAYLQRMRQRESGKKVLVSMKALKGRA